MTKSEMLAAYHHLNAAASYIIGFVHHDALYAVTLPAIPVEAVRMSKTSSKRGAVSQLRLKVTEALKQLWLPTAVNLGAADQLVKTATMNRGEQFEALITGAGWVKDSTPFWVAGDIRLAGIETQIKLDGAEICNEKNLHRAAGLA